MSLICVNILTFGGVLSEQFAFFCLGGGCALTKGSKFHHFQFGEFHSSIQISTTIYDVCKVVHIEIESIMVLIQKCHNLILIKES